MTRIQAHFRVVTPLFLAGYDQSTAELRVPSIKGVLRFWWRALEGMRLGDKLSATENELFGSTSNQSSVLMRVEKVGEWPQPQIGRRDGDSAVLTQLGGNNRNIGARYLAYGVVDAFGSRNTGRQAGQLQRGAISQESGIEFKLHLVLRSSKYVSSLSNAIKLMGLLGSLGSKSRKGYGSLCLTELRVGGSNDVWIAPATIEELKNELAKLWRYALNGQPPNRSAPEPPFTQLSPLSQMLLLQASDATDSITLLDRVGREMVRYRSWGNGGKILGTEDSERNFRDDHDLSKTSPQNIKSHPKRLVFGLPHNYGRGSNVEGVGENGQRRASPLFIHIHQPSPQIKPIAVVAFLPSVFLQNPKVRVFGKTVDLDPSLQLWQPITNFLTRLKGTHQKGPLERKEKFDAVVEVI